MSERNPGRSRHRGSQSRNGKGRYDQALIQAKNDDKAVELVLALEDPIADSATGDLATVKILEVDTYAIRVKSVRHLREAWISKAFIVSASILS